MTSARTLCALCFISSTAFAGDVLTFDAVRDVTHGDALPSITFHVGAAGMLEVDARCGSKRWSLEQNARAGSDVRLPFTGVAPGSHDCAVVVAFRQEGMEPVGTELNFSVVSRAPLALTWTEQDVDVDAGTVVVGSDQPIVSGTLTVFGPRGVELAQGTLDVSEPRRPRFSWDASTGEAVKLSLAFEGQEGGRAVLELFPWSYSIPHVDVVFATGSDVVVAEEAPKLEAAMAEVRTTLETYGSIVEMELFVAGYTDTVGDAASNIELSMRRARSIARWFRSHGFHGRVWYQGFGESVQAVSTADNTDEAANRRADYVLAAQPPPASSAYPAANWRPL